MINYIAGDATYPSAQGKIIIAHVCNDVGAWGKGFVMAVSKRWPFAKTAYKQSPRWALGEIQIVQVEDDIEVVNMIAQRGIRRHQNDPPAIDYEALRECLRKVGQWAKYNNASVHCPYIGTGLAGGDWKTIERIIKDELCLKGVEVFVYSLT